MMDVDPIVVSVELAATPAQAFAAFTSGFADWWPVATHSLSRQAGTRCDLDATMGGALEERAPDGARHLWGTVESIEPGHSLRFSWHPGREPDTAQWVAVVFAPRGIGSRATLTHGGWEA
ncbi:MAG: SRPBCC domain-containing protein, partial [Steroidobacteraceae bacterium]